MSKIKDKLMETAEKLYDGDIEAAIKADEIEKEISFLSWDIEKKQKLLKEKKEQLDNLKKGQYV